MDRTLARALLLVLLAAGAAPAGRAAATASPGDHPEEVRAREAIRALGGSFVLAPSRSPSAGLWERSRPARDLRIRRVDLHATVVTDADLARLAALPALRELEALDLRLTTVGDPAMSSVRRFKKLRFLNLFRTRVGDGGLAALRPLAGLDTLLIGGTRVTDDGLRHLRRFERLSRLSLFDTGVTDAGLPHLDPLRRLEVVLVERSGVTPAGVARLRAAHPGLRTTE
jgi:hypothetical protein